jgi:hypothetical protein
MPGWSQLESASGSGMRINWVVADATVIAPDVDIAAVKDIASIWGSWRTWRGCSTDNVVCNDAGKARELLKRNMQEMCNMYIPESMYAELDRPRSVRLFGGQLVSGQSDIVLLMGFDWTEKPISSDRLIAHRANNYRKFVVDAVQNNPQVQWVLVDHEGDVMPELADFDNLTQDTLQNVMELLST